MFLFGFCAVRPLFRLLIAAASARSSLPSFLRRYGFTLAVACQCARRRDALESRESSAQCSRARCRMP